MKDINYLEEMSNFVVASKYARYNPSLRRREIWEESVQRNLNMHLRKFSHLDEADVSEIKRAFEMVKEKWIIPSMRSMQFGGPAIEQSNARMYNCATIHIASIRSFAEVFYMLLCGAGVTVGLNTRFMSRLPNLVDASDKNGVVLTYVVEDTIEGWSNSLEALLSCYFRNTPFTGRKIIFDYSRIRKKGALLKTSGGKAPGYKGLKACHIKIKQLLDFIIEQQRQTRLKTINAYDILMHASDAVLSGGIRRSAMMAIFEESDVDMLNSKAVFDVDHISRYSVDDTTNVAEVKLVIDRKEYVVSFDLKKAFDKYDYEKLLVEKKISWFWVEPQRARSNNSVLLLRKDLTLEKFKHYIQTAQLYGEPGFLLADDPYTLVNPCAEIGMIPVTEDGRCGVQVCNLTSINGAKVHTVEEFQAAAKAAALIGTLQAAYTDFPFLSTATKQITEQEALLGVSITGILDNPELFLNKEALRAAAATVVAVNKEWAAKLGINQAARTTAIKPEGCVTGDTYINTSEGILTMDEIRERFVKTSGDCVAIKGLSVQTDAANMGVSHYFFNGKKPTKVIKFDSGLTLEATLQHKFRVITDQGEYLWKPTADLKEGDILPYMVGAYNGGSYQTLYYTPSKKSKYAANLVDLKYIPTKLNEDLAWLLGVYFGDGTNHKKGIRIYGNSDEKKGFDRIEEVLFSLFGLSTYYEKHNDDSKRCRIGVNSACLLDFLAQNKLLKQKSKHIEIPQIIRRSPKSVILSFLEGFAVADGSTKTPTQTYFTSSKKFAEQLVVLLRAVGKDAKLREYISKSSFSKNKKYWISERKGRQTKHCSTYKRHYHTLLDNMNLPSTMNVDKILSITDSESETYDLTVVDTHTYLANSFVSHNTSSLVLGSASGIHPHHARKYFRRIQCNHEDPVYQFFKQYNPHACEASMWSANHTDDVISFPVEIPETAMIKADLSALDHLKIIQTVQENWVLPGTTPVNKKPIRHNVSCTVIVKNDEWDTAIEHIYNNREFYTAVSFIPETGDKIYQQAPLEAVTTKEDAVLFDLLKKSWLEVDYSKMHENSDGTAHTQEAACVGGACELTRI